MLSQRKCRVCTIYSLRKMLELLEISMSISINKTSGLLRILFNVEFLQNTRLFGKPVLFYSQSGVSRIKKIHH